MDIAALILAEFKIAEKVMITIKKLNPPLKNFNGKVGVRFELKR
jgi:dihydroneopterin aldolase